MVKTVVARQSRKIKIRVFCMLASSIVGVVTSLGGTAYEATSSLVDSITHQIEKSILEKACANAADVLEDAVPNFCDPTQPLEDRFSSWTKEKFQNLKDRLTGDGVQADANSPAEADQAATEDADNLAKTSTEPPSTEVVNEEVAEGDEASVDQTKAPTQLEAQASDTNPADQTQAQQAQTELTDELEPEPGVTTDTLVADPVADAEMANGAADAADASSAETTAVVDAPEEAATSTTALVGEGVDIASIASKVGSMVFSETNLLVGAAVAVWEIGSAANQDITEWDTGPSGWDPTQGEDPSIFKVLGGDLDVVFGKTAYGTDTQSAIGACGTTAGTTPAEDPYLMDNYLSAFNSPDSLIAETLFWDWNPDQDGTSGTYPSVPDLYDFKDFTGQVNFASGCAGPGGQMTMATVNSTFQSAEQDQSLYSVLDDTRNIPLADLSWLSQVGWPTAMGQGQTGILGEDGSIPISQLHSGPSALDAAAALPALSWTAIGTISGTGTIDAACGNASPNPECSQSYTNVQNHIQSAEADIQTQQQDEANPGPGDSVASNEAAITNDQQTISNDETWLGTAFPDGADLVATVLNNRGVAYNGLVSELAAGNTQEYLELETVASQATHPASETAIQDDLKAALAASGTASSSNLPQTQADGTPGILGNVAQDGGVTLGSDPNDSTMPDTTTQGMIMALIDYEGGAATCTSTDCTQDVQNAPIGTEGNAGETGMLPTQYAKYMAQTGSCTSQCTSSDGESNQISAAGMALAHYLKVDGGSVLGAFADYVRDNRLPPMDGSFGTTTSTTSDDGYPAAPDTGPLANGWGSLAVASDGSPSHLPTAVVLAEMASQYTTYLNTQEGTDDAAPAAGSSASASASADGATLLAYTVAAPKAFHGYSIVDGDFTTGITGAAAQAKIPASELYAIADINQIYGSDGLASSAGVNASAFSPATEVTGPDGSPTAIADAPQYGDVSSGVNPGEQCSQQEVYPLSTTSDPGTDQAFVHPTSVDTYGMFQLTVQEFQEFGAQAGLSSAVLGSDAPPSEVAPNLGYCPDMGEPEAMMDPDIEAQAAAFLLKDLQHGTGVVDNSIVGNDPTSSTLTATGMSVGDVLDGALEAYFTRNWICPDQGSTNVVGTSPSASTIDTSPSASAIDTSPTPQYAEPCPVSTLNSSGLWDFDNAGSQGTFDYVATRRSGDTEDKAGSVAQLISTINNGGGSESMTTVGSDWGWTPANNGAYTANEVALLQAWIQMAPEVATAVAGSIPAYVAWQTADYTTLEAPIPSVPGSPTVCTGAGCPPAGQFWAPGMKPYGIPQDLAATRGAFSGYIPVNLPPAMAIFEVYGYQCTMWAAMNSEDINGVPDDAGGNGWAVAKESPDGILVSEEPTVMPPVGSIVSFSGPSANGAYSDNRGHVALVVYTDPTAGWYEISQLNASGTGTSNMVSFQQMAFAGKVTGRGEGGIATDDSLDGWIPQPLVAETAGSS
jgi:hypothetical protein